MKLLLHACCGPCSLEPVRLLQQAGHQLSIAYLNSNIAPAAEFERRRDELIAWATRQEIPVVRGTWNPQAWEDTAGRVGQAALDAAGGDVELMATNASLREARCRACYRLRFEETAQAAVNLGVDAIGTTLSVSPYQFSDIIQEELERAAALVGVEAIFEDYRPYYEQATQRSRSIGMYRQNYCGCRFSCEEATAERALRKQERLAARKAQLSQQAEERAEQFAKLSEERAQKQAYAQKQARKQAMLKAFKAQGAAHDH